MEKEIVLDYGGRRYVRATIYGERDEAIIRFSEPVDYLYLSPPVVSFLEEAILEARQGKLRFGE